ncbi:uncharacterized protein FIBRA_00735 [Fibroporia radiculosa]|uniref:Amidase domain-containing protein n=1 Tax=Fibroporia radiculosa TaxID=599839 RepID=J4GIG7_9APHY|nr:uncharacterized protein FIBRA_00735 [Fibroporia radiculosa]CCL98730.1 predicted protein [Fibroporia radiculosa]
MKSFSAVVLLYIFTVICSIKVACASTKSTQSTSRQNKLLGRAALPDLYETSVAELQDGLDTGDFTSVDLAYFARIQEVNLRGPQLRALIETNPSALQQAVALDAERLVYGKRSMLHGIPVLVKDNIGTIASEGKANLSEFAHFRGNLASGWSGRGGQCTNAYFPHADPCGSSAGSGVAASIGLAAVTLGTETDGSITCPADHNNVVGIKPTVGLTSRAGVIPISEHQDTVGPLTRSIADAAIVLSVIAGPDVNDNFTLAQPLPVPEYALALNKTALSGKRIGVPRSVFLNDTITGNDPYVNFIFEEALSIIRSLGATVVDPADLPSAEAIVSSNNETIVLDVQLDAYYAALLENPSGVRSLAELIQFNNDNPSLEEPPRYTDQSILIASEATSGFNSTYYAALAFDKEMGATQGIDAALKAYDLDALVLPAPGFTTVPAAIAGYPIVTVPLGFYPDNVTIGLAGPETVYPAPGVPIGLSFLGTAFSEFELISYAYAYEQNTHTRLARKAYPEAIPTVQLWDIIYGSYGDE